MRLLAKSKPTEETIKQHSLKTYEVAKELLFLGERACDVFGLDKEIWLPKLKRLLPIIAFLHDFGKANNYFQGMLLRELKYKYQAFRHEYLTAWMIIKSRELQEWISKDINDIICVISAIIGHHTKFREAKDIIEPRKEAISNRLHVYYGEKDFKECIEFLEALGLPPNCFPDKNEEMNTYDEDIIFKELRDFIERAEDIKEDDSVLRFRLLIKTLLMCCDGIASASSRTGLSSAWAKDALNRVCTKEELADVVRCSLLDKEGNAMKPRSFQKRIAKSKTRVTLAEAGTGGGKTTGAYMWFEKRAVGKKPFYSYPTTGTTAAGYTDYLVSSKSEKDVPDLRHLSKLLNSRANVDLEFIKAEHGNDIDNDATIQKINSLRMYDSKIVICTVDQILGIIQNHSAQLYSFAALLQGVFVFDEIHMMDDQMFSALLDFIRIFKHSDILLMTATIQPERKRLLRKALKESGEKLTVVRGAKELEKIKRHKICEKLILFKDINWSDIRDKLNKQFYKILMVVNTVGRLQEYGREVEKQLGAEILSYHSRYKYVHRVKKHIEIMRTFRTEKGVFAITTQVCEVSLDISADLLISDLASIPALIQRLGRANRYASDGDVPKEIWIMELPLDQNGYYLPYTLREIEEGRDFIARLAGKSVSQEDLKKCSDLCYTEKTFQRKPSEWTGEDPTGGSSNLFYTKKETIRDGGSISIITEEDAKLCYNEKFKDYDKTEVLKYSIPMLYGPAKSLEVVATHPTASFSFIVYAGDIEYSEKWGAIWAKKT
jgi:CRISPR-associated endonuclease/helicase Cas3